MIDEATVTAVLTVATITVIVLAIRRSGNGYNGKPRPPSLPALPIVGSLPYLGGQLHELPDKFLKLSAKLGPVISFYAGRNVAFVLNGKKAISDALLKHAEAFADRPEMWPERNVVNLELRGLGYSHYDDTCKKYQKLTLSILKEFGFGLSQEQDVRIWNEVEKMIEKIRAQNGRSFDPRHLTVHSTSNVIVNILFGEEFQCMKTELEKVVQNAHKYVENIDPAIDMAPLIRFLPTYRKKIINMKEANDAMMEGFEIAIECSKTSKSAESTFTKRFLEIEGPNYDHKDLLYVLRDLCLGSSDTVALLVLWAVVEMANHSDVKIRVQKEIDDVVSEDRLPSYDDRLNLPYTEATTLELSRLHTLGPFGIPHATLKDTEVLGYFVPKGSLVLPNYYSAHMDPETWTDPENFSPERFLNEDNKIVGREKIIQFGVGKRSCPGENLARQEFFVFFSSLLQHFDILPPEGQTSIKVENDSGLTVGPTPFQIRMIPRKGSK